MDDAKHKEWVVRKLERLVDDVTEVRVTLAKNTESLEHHVRRTDLLEKRVDGLWLRVLTVVGGLVGIAAGIARIVWH